MAPCPRRSRLGAYVRRAPPRANPFVAAIRPKSVVNDVIQILEFKSNNRSAFVLQDSYARLRTDDGNMGDRAMTSFQAFHVFAAARGDGLRSELRAVLERAATDDHLEITMRRDGMLQSGPDPKSEAIQARTEVLRFLRGPAHPEATQDSNSAARSARKDTP
jgi:hypothetical protein